MSTTAMYEGFALDRELLALRNELRARRTESGVAARAYRAAAGEAGEWLATADGLSAELAAVWA